MTPIKSNVLDAMRHPRTVTRDTIKTWNPQRPPAVQDPINTSLTHPESRVAPAPQGLHAAFGAPLEKRR